MPRKIIGAAPNGDNLIIVEVFESLRKSEIAGVSTVSIDGVSNGNQEPWTAELPLPQELVTNRIVHFPFSGSRKIEQAAPFELESWVPFGSDEFAADYQVIEKEKNSATALVAGAKKKDVKNWIDEWTEKGVAPRSAVPEGFAYRNLAALMGAGKNEVLAFLDVRKDRCILSVTRGDRALLGRSLPWGIDDLSDEAGSRNSFSRLFHEISNTFRFLEVEEGKVPEKLYLCGEGAGAAGLADALADKLGLQTAIWAGPETTGVKLGPEHALALALAMEHSRPSKGINLRKGELAYRTETAIIGEKFIMPAVFAAGIFILLMVNSLFHNRILQSRVNELDAEIAAVAKVLMPDKDIRPSNALRVINQELENTRKLVGAIGKTDRLTPLNAMTVVSRKIPPEINADVDEFTLTERILTIGGTINQYSEMDAIVDKLKEFEAFKKFDPPTLREKVGDEGGVRFTQKIFLTEEEEKEGG